MDKNDTIQIKKQIIDEQMAEFWKFCNGAMVNYDCCSRSSKVIPDSVQEFSAIFLENLTKLVNSI
jgi:hypothetical protein